MSASHHDDHALPHHSAVDEHSLLLDISRSSAEAAVESRNATAAVNLLTVRVDGMAQAMGEHTATLKVLMDDRTAKQNESSQHRIHHSVASKGAIITIVLAVIGWVKDIWDVYVPKLAPHHH